MPCKYFRKVKDDKRRSTAGVLGYCAGYSEEKLRIPTLEEYKNFCSTEKQRGCPVFDYRESSLFKKQSGGKGKSGTRENGKC